MSERIEYSDYLEHFYLKAKMAEIPYHGDFEITSHCNLKCKFCYISNTKYRENRDLPTDFWKSIIAQAVQNGMISCNLTGGEALTRKDFCEIYGFAYDLGLRICILSNGIGITDEIINLLRHRKPEAVSITLYGFCENTYLRICQTPNVFHKVLNNIDKLIQAKIPISLKISALPDIDEAEYVELRKFANERNLRIGLVKYISPVRSEIDCGQMDWRLPAKRIKKIQEIVEDAETELPPIGNKGSNEWFDCGFAKTRFAVSHKGELFGCLSYTEIYEDLTEGILLAEALKNLRKKAEQFRDIFEFKCKECPLFERCNKCPGLNYCETGKINSCSEYRKQLVYECVI